jgi:hypothetical protein
LGQTRARESVRGSQRTGKDVEFCEKKRRVDMRSKLFTSLVIVALLCLIGWTVYGQRTRSGWEYKVDPVPDGGSMQQLQAQANERLINQRAGEGWELTAVGVSYFYFKRAR